MKIEIKTNVSLDRVADLLCCGFEGGVGYWARIADYKDPPERKNFLGVGYVDIPLSGGAVLIQSHGDDTAEGTDDEGYLIDDKGERIEVKSLDMDAIKKGLALMAEKAPRAWGDFLAENEDANTGDIFIQLCLFGEVRYG